MIIIKEKLKKKTSHKKNLFWDPMIHEITHTKNKIDMIKPMQKIILVHPHSSQKGADKKNIKKNYQELSLFSLSNSSLKRGITQKFSINFE